MIRKVVLGFVGLALLAVVGVLVFFEKPTGRFHEQAPEMLELRAGSDAQRYKTYVVHIQKLEQQLGASAQLFDRDKSAALTPDERKQALSMFSDVVDHVAALDQIARYHFEFWKLSPLGDRDRHARHFALFFAAYCEKLALGSLFIDRTINKPQFEKLFDEGSPTFGLSAGAYRSLKWNVVHVEDAAKALAAHQWMRTLSSPLKRLAASDQSTWGFLLNRLEDRYQTARTQLANKSVKLFGGNTVDLTKEAAHTVWFPVQTEVAEVLGDTKVKRLHGSLITEEQVKDVLPLSEPGDILVERRNWYLSNIGLPGFWPHAALYLGTADELRAYFNDPQLEKAFGKPFADHLADKFPAAWSHYLENEETDHGSFPRRVIEAMSEGVVFTSAEHSIGTADYVAALRPQLSKLEKARAIERAIGYEGRPYDFDFDFYTDSSLVCSELVYKAYEPRDGIKGLKLPLERVVGRMTLGPNTVVRQFDDEYQTPAQQMAFAWFLDGREKDSSAVLADVTAFRASHRRPKWDIVQQ